jgi:hypothetical protein
MPATWFKSAASEKVSRVLWANQAPNGKTPLDNSCSVRRALRLWFWVYFWTCGQLVEPFIPNLMIPVSSQKTERFTRYPLVGRVVTTLVSHVSSHVLP